MCGSVQMYSGSCDHESTTQGELSSLHLRLSSVKRGHDNANNCGTVHLLNVKKTGLY